MFFGWFSPKKLQTSENNIWQKTWTINISSTSTFRLHSLPRATQILLRGHGRLCSVHPRPPSPPGAVRPRNRGRWGLRSAAVLCLGSRSPRPATGRTQRNEGEKVWDNFGRLKSRSFGNCGHSKILPGLKEQCALEVFMTSSWLKKAMWTRLAVKMLWGNLENAPSLRKQICVRLGHNRIWNQSRAVDISCNRVRGLAHILTGKKHKFLRFVRTANNDPVKQCLITVYTISEWTLQNLRNSLNCDGHDTLFLD